MKKDIKSWEDLEASTKRALGEDKGNEIVDFFRKSSKNLFVTRAEFTLRLAHFQLNLWMIGTALAAIIVGAFITLVFVNQPQCECVCGSTKNPPASEMRTN